jgi:hypothetical protein
MVRCAAHRVAEFVSTGRPASLALPDKDQFWFFRAAPVAGVPGGNT